MSLLYSENRSKDFGFIRCNICATDDTLILPSPVLSLCKNVLCDFAFSLTSGGQ